MEIIDRVKQLCSEKGIALYTLESALGFGNGSLAKTKNMSADRLYAIANYFHVSMEYIMTGSDDTMSQKEDKNELSEKELEIYKEKERVLKELNIANQELLEIYQKIGTCQTRKDVLEERLRDLDNQLTELKKDDFTLDFSIFKE